MTSEEFISENEVAAMLGKAVQTVRNWRGKATSYGPRYFKIGHNVRYKRADVVAWIEAQIVDPSSGRAA